MNPDLQLLIIAITGILLYRAQSTLDRHLTERRRHAENHRAHLDAVERIEARGVHIPASSAAAVASTLIGSTRANEPAIAAAIDAIMAAYGWAVEDVEGSFVTRHAEPYDQDQDDGR